MFIIKLNQPKQQQCEATAVQSNNSAKQQQCEATAVQSNSIPFPNTVSMMEGTNGK